MVRQNTQEYFAVWLKENMPYLMRLFDFEKNEYKHDALNAYLKTASQGERIMAQFAIGVWRGDNEFAFNFVEAAGYLDRNQIKVVAEWLIDPFWP